ncbi:MAG: TlpA family protein disulfide reductase, partial [Sedimenticola sp.]|nr:TlpA family protein disulfide reductase [Sedimenticola sp.]
MNKLYSIALCLLLVCGSAIAGKGIETLETPRTVSDFLLPGLDGKQHKLADYRGKYLLVNFWAVWC